MIKPRNKVVLYTGIYEEKKKVEITNFSSIKKTWNNDKCVIRIHCFNGKIYEFRTVITSIAEIQIYE